MCGFVTPLQGPEADAHRKPEVGETKGTTAHLPPPRTRPLPRVPLCTGREGPAEGDRVGGEVSAAPRTEPPPGLPQAVVLEGNYWKRRIEVVMREYHKWRIYYKKRVSGDPGGRAGLFPGRCWPPLLLEEPKEAPPPSDKTQADSALVWP